MLAAERQLPDVFGFCLQSLSLRPWPAGRWLYSRLQKKKDAIFLSSKTLSCIGTVSAGDALSV